MRKDCYDSVVLRAEPSARSGGATEVQAYLLFVPARSPLRLLQKKSVEPGCSARECRRSASTRSAIESRPSATGRFRPIPDTVMTSGGAQLVFRFDLFGVLSSAAVVAL